MIKTKIIQTRLVPKGNIIAITLFGLVFTRNKKRCDKYIRNHELIHCQQQLEWLYIPFFIFYVVEWLILMVKYRNWDKAYRMISFEQEAYSNDHNLNYLKHRPLYASLRYLRKRKRK